LPSMLPVASAYTHASAPFLLFHIYIYIPSHTPPANNNNNTSNEPHPPYTPPRAQREEAQRRDREAGFGDGGVHPEFRSSYGPSSSSAYTSSAGGSTYGSSTGGGAGAQPQPTYLSSASQTAVAMRAAAAGLPSSSAPAVAIPMIPPPGPAPMAVPVSLGGSSAAHSGGGPFGVEPESVSNVLSVQYPRAGGAPVGVGERGEYG
jgi:hypothetical protein